MKIESTFLLNQKVRQGLMKTVRNNESNKILSAKLSQKNSSVTSLIKIMSMATILPLKARVDRFFSKVRNFRMPLTDERGMNE